MISRSLNKVTDVPTDADRAVLDCLTNRSNWRFASSSESSSKMIPSTPATNLYSVMEMLSPSLPISRAYCNANIAPVVRRASLSSYPHPQIASSASEQLPNLLLSVVSPTTPKNAKFTSLAELFRERVADSHFCLIFCKKDENHVHYKFCTSTSAIQPSYIVILCCPNAAPSS